MKSKDCYVKITELNKVCWFALVKEVKDEKNDREKESSLSFSPFWLHCQLLVQTERARRRLWFFNFSCFFSTLYSERPFGRVTSTHILVEFQMVFSSSKFYLRISHLRSQSIDDWDRKLNIWFFWSLFFYLRYFNETMLLKCDTCFKNACFQINHHISVTKYLENAWHFTD